MSLGSPSDKFAWGADVLLSQCMLCKRLDPDAPNAVCAAFPGQIPQEIMSNEVDHRKPWIDPETGLPGDQGIAPVVVKGALAAPGRARRAPGACCSGLCGSRIHRAQFG
jgi:hypothetical protein